jgi:arylsulfatase A
MNRREFLRASGLGIAALAISRCYEGLAEGNVSARKPNIIFILTDDVGIGNIGCYGSDKFKTPCIDKLAATGIKFEYCYSTPLCGPSRCQSLTGRYPFRTGLISNKSHEAVSPEKEIMMPTVMKRAGYATALVGKWGQICLGPGEWGFEEYITFAGSGRYWKSQKAGYMENGREKQLADNEYMPDVMHKFLVDFMKRNKEKPFYVHYSMAHMHGKILRTPDSKEDSKDFYADNNAYMDKLVGQLADELEKLGLRKDTLIVFTGDNGTAAFGEEQATIGGKRLNGAKGSMLEGGSRVPLLVSWTGVAPEGKENHDLTDFSDFFPTFAELGRGELPEGVTIDGHSFASQIKGGKGTPREWVYVELKGESYARNSRWKLANNGELFDMKEAPFKEIPVAADSDDAEAIAARKSLQTIIDQHPAAPAVAGNKTKKKGKL